MADPIKAIGAILKADGAVASLAGTRVFRKRLPDKPTYPAIEYFTVVGIARPNHDGASTRFNTRVQVNCHAESPVANQLYQAALAALDNVAKGTYADINVTGIQFIDNNADYQSDTEIDVESFDVELFFVQ